MGVRGNACDLSLLPSMRLPCPSFRRKTEPSLFKSLLDPGFRRGDDPTHGLVLKSQVLGVRGKGRFSKRLFPRKSYTLESALVSTPYQALEVSGLRGVVGEDGSDQIRLKLQVVD